MRGEILNFDDVSGTGVISGNDGRRYTFARSSFQLPTAPGSGQRVDFEARGDEAVDILVVGPSAAATGDGRYASQDYGGATGGYTGYAATPAGIQTGFDWQKVFLSFNGRTRRSHFWLAWVILFVANIVLSFIPIIGGLISLALIWPSIAIQVTRLHDMGFTGWLVTIPWVANIIGFIAIISTVGLAAFANADQWEDAEPAEVMGLLGPAFGILGILIAIGIGFLLWIGITDSKPGPNRFGPNPKDPLAGTADTFA